MSSEPEQPWRTLPQILVRLHQEGIYLRLGQLAEFFLAHGLPVDLQYVPSHLQAKATQINQNYQGDMACFQGQLHVQEESEIASLEQIYPR